MIIWLASYPRSGNTLLRTILKTTMGLNSYSDEATHVHRILSGSARESFGHLDLSLEWDKFYAEASASPGIFLVKTHQAPRDNQPAIHIVRDGRAVLYSYCRYLNSFFPEADKTLLHTISGDVTYGDWSAHYDAWNNRSGEKLELRFENLVECRADDLLPLAEFVRFQGRPKDWKNPLVALHQENPEFFRAGWTSWVRPEEWSDALDFLFHILHGRVMAKLGYGSDGCPTSRAAHEQLAVLFRQIVQEKMNYEMSCIAKQNVIDELAAACLDRDKLTAELHNECESRMHIIERLLDK